MAKKATADKTAQISRLKDSIGDYEKKVQDTEKLFNSAEKWIKYLQKSKFDVQHNSRLSREAVEKQIRHYDERIKREKYRRRRVLSELDEYKDKLAKLREQLSQLEPSDTTTASS